jgi:hypothetical protein
LLLSASLFGAPAKAAETTEAATTQPARDWPLDGAYSFEGRTVFVGLSGEPPDVPELEIYDPFTRRIDNLRFGRSVSQRARAIPLDEPA